ncbi:MAG: Rieske 2Fe-2S domain-containing protein [Deltaproteobacteria bacterium]|nr:Rieske 2Fe-2S domain-containing protein [Deltaproteobacteria bacterium]MBI3293686.1 Rieske 2Fe-2S domain-containing protein [Deltaproteobacteria bacterium]
MKCAVAIPKSEFINKAAVTFEGDVGGRLVQGVVAFAGGRYFAYQNLCKHVPINLDCGDGNVLNEEGTRFQCHMHGAIYEFETGECTAGPCVGAQLNTFTVIDDGSRIVVELPENPELV